jgi:hypothetical protein
MRGWALVPALVAAVACGRAGAPVPVPASTQLDGALDALDRGQHSVAVADLAALAGECPATPVARYALLLAASASLDPRNPSRDPTASAGFAARYLAAVPVGDSSGRPLAEVLYLLALELGGKAEKVKQSPCQAPAGGAAPLPSARGPSVPERINALERELATLREELARIRKTLEP